MAASISYLSELPATAELVIRRQRGGRGHGVMSSPGSSQIVIETITGALPPARNPFCPDHDFAAHAREMDQL